MRAAAARFTSSSLAWRASRCRCIMLACAIGVADRRAVAQVRPSSPRSTLLVSVSDAANGAFIGHAQVQLPRLRRVVVTDWRGEARVDSIDSGVYRLDVRAFGYAASSIELSVRQDTEWVLFQLERLPVRLDTVRITAAPSSPQIAEYQHRRQMGIGRFLPESALARLGDQRLSIVLATHIPGLLAATDGLVDLEPSGIGGTQCGINIYLDGFMLTGLGLDDIRPRDLTGIEVYSRASAPPAYRPVGNYCRVILLWSKW